MNNEKIRVLGKGLTAKAIKEKFPQAILYDDNDFFTYDKNSNDITIVSPGIPPYKHIVKNSNNIQSEYDLFSEIMPFSIWISGTNGKTTTTQMMQNILKERDSICGGNIGTPLGLMDEKKKIWILETSSFTLHYTNKAKANIYVLLPISEDHISWHGSYEEYKYSKIKPVLSMEEGEVAIVPYEFKDIKTDAFLITYKNSDELCEIFNMSKEKVKFKEPFLLDALLALAVKKILFDEVDYKGINDFVIDKHKIEEFYDYKHRLWVDDSKATNIDATVNALIPYKGKKIHIILGGDDKGAKLEPLFTELKNYDVEIYAIGSNTKKLISLAKKYELVSNECNFLKNAVVLINEKMTQDSLGILSPSASSLDQFKSYKQRGEEFKEFVFNLSEL